MYKTCSPFIFLFLFNAFVNVHSSERDLSKLEKELVIILSKLDKQNKSELTNYYLKGLDSLMVRIKNSKDLAIPKINKLIERPE